MKKGWLEAGGYILDSYCVVISGLQAGVSDSEAAWAQVAAAFKLDKASFAGRVLVALPLIVRQKLDKEAANQIVQQLTARLVEAMVLPDDDQHAYIMRGNSVRGPLPLSGLEMFIKNGEQYQLANSDKWESWMEPLPPLDLPPVVPAPVEPVKTGPVEAPPAALREPTKATQVKLRTPARIGLAFIVLCAGLAGWSLISNPNQLGTMQSNVGPHRMISLGITRVQSCSYEGDFAGGAGFKCVVKNTSTDEPRDVSNTSCAGFDSQNRLVRSVDRVYDLNNAVMAPSEERVVRIYAPEDSTLLVCAENGDVLTPAQVQNEMSRDPRFRTIESELSF